jgi:TRAP-type C4-dicarboxylate transport system permease small subunit
MIRTLDKVFALLAGAGTASLIVAIAMVALDVVIRKIMQRSLVGTVDVTELVVMIAAFTALPLVFLRKGHVSVEIVTDLMPPRWRALFQGIGALLGAGLFAAIGYLAFQPARLSISAGDVSQDLALPLAWYWIPMIAGCFLGALAALVMALSHFHEAVRSDPA